MSYKKFLVTGGSGFVGKALINRLALLSECSVIAPVRDISMSFPLGVRSIPFTSLDAVFDLSDVLKGVDCVVHAAARVHVMNDVSADPLAAFRKVNVEATLRLARQAAASGVKRFIFISSIKVNGEGTDSGIAFNADDIPAPIDAYGISKLEAEQGLKVLAADTGMEVVIIRPVLVYGPGVKANFLSMMRWLYRGVPLPFGAVYNHRSLVAIDNLVDLIVTCSHHPAAANQVFLVSDGEDVSTTQLLRKLAAALGKSAILLPIPARLMSNAAALLGQRALLDRILGSLQVDISKNRQLLGWTPPVTLDKALSLTAQHFLDSRKS
ncbi:Nucleoside-diphosphate-sugar epimerase [Pseudomonas sp. LAMO17WK12:I6]|jgi:nucleoside-diphosphate-sugar epimerase|uniref:UDP-glucose 4-epimerase family protein n=1 Tax=unclassified Pseudomonas TaxID=196821 RepID=UPI000BD691F9|nr:MULTISPECIES: SDR family oxidoreductase [unclassified Pseudomonas]SNY27041.1 Nucleoside-diphosphate-sugar epimerase [Pseudomonas sp. LAMO17WK12:I6]SNY28991.1 Nucleoside-diphosphate-sugar epimerase [Pseudomonas sp. LAMO17WK12:I5]